MKAILLAGGKGTRLRPLTVHTPKPIVPIFDRPFLYYQLDLLRQVPEIDEVILSLNYQPRRIEEVFGDGHALGIKIRYAVEHEPLERAAGARFEQHLRGFDVVLRVGAKIATPALSDPSLSRQMKDVGGVFEDRRQVGALERGLDEPEPGTRLQSRQIRFLDRSGVIVGKAVDACYRGTAIEQRAGQVRSDEAGNACDECIHEKAILIFSGIRAGRPDAFKDA